MPTPVRYTEAEWFALGRSLFGPDVFCWRFVCPCCGHEQTVADFRGRVPKGTPADVAFANCIGRYDPASRDAFGSGPGPCNYTSGGLFNLNPVTVLRGAGVPLHVFAFAQPVAARVA